MTRPVLTGRYSVARIAMDRNTNAQILTGMALTRIVVKRIGIKRSDVDRLDADSRGGIPLLKSL